MFILLLFASVAKSEQSVWTDCVQDYRENMRTISKIPSFIGVFVENKTLVKLLFIENDHITNTSFWVTLSYFCHHWDLVYIYEYEPPKLATLDNIRRDVSLIFRQKRYIYDNPDIKRFYYTFMQRYVNALDKLTNFTNITDIVNYRDPYRLAASIAITSNIIKQHMACKAAFVVTQNISIRYKSEFLPRTTQDLHFELKINTDTYIFPSFNDVYVMIKKKCPRCIN